MDLPARRRGPAGLSGARVLALGCLLLLGLACDGRGERPRNVLVVTIDTLRRDAVGFHGRAPSPTPVLDALAREAVVFDDAYTVAPITLPAHASLHSGLYPASHGVRDNGALRLPDGVETLAERFRARGYQTLASVAAFVLDPCFGLDQGFERYVAPPRELGIELNLGQVRADRAVDALLAELDRLGGRTPWFAWLHLFDPHAPYDAPGAPRGLEGMAAYLEEVRYADRELGRLFGALRARGVFDELLLVVTSDHGEGLGDGPEPTHGFFVHDPTMRVPLLVRDPELRPTRWPHPTSLVDVAPTLLSLARVPGDPSAFDGLDLSRTITGDDRAGPAQRVLLIESHLPWISYGWSPSEGGVFDARKVIRSARVEVYDRVSDPREERNLAAGGAAPEDAERLARVDARMRALEGRFAHEAAAVGAAEAGALEALGYAGGGTGLGLEGRPPFERLPDAYAMRASIDRLDALHAAVARGDLAGGLAALRVLVAEDPDNAAFLERLGEMLLFAGPQNAFEAERILARAAELRPGRSRVHLNLATCAHLANDPDRAERELRAALALEPDLPLALQNLSFALRERAERAAPPERRALYAEARDLLDRLLAILAPDDPRRPEIAAARAHVAKRATGR